MSYLITLFSRPGDTVLDPFVGSGTTVVAAKQLQRIGIGIEREPEYAEIASARYDAAEVVEPEEDKQLELV
jgi:DNA modification methylase